jgi:hypothetical protein
VLAAKTRAGPAAKLNRMPTLVGLSRWQFAITVMFHMTFPAITVGLSIFLCVVYGRYWRTGKAVYLQMFRFWRRIFAVGFIGDNIHIGRPPASRAEVERGCGVHRVLLPRPSGGVRAFALGRIGANYASRVVLHSAALRRVSAARLRFYDRAGASPSDGTWSVPSRHIPTCCSSTSRPPAWTPTSDPTCSPPSAAYHRTRYPFW